MLTEAQLSYGDADAVVTVAEVLAKSLRISNARLQPTLDAVVAMAADLSACDVGVIMVERGRLIPKAVTGKAPHLLDLYQQQRREGPCLEAAERQEVVRLAEVQTDPRWNGFGQHAASLGVGSMLCFPLWVDDECLGTLSLYAGKPNAFDAQDERLARVSGTLAAVALASARHSERLHEALESRDLIGQAKGILMEREKIKADRAFELLASTSQRRNLKLTVIAEHLVATGELPGGPDAI